MRNMPKLLPGTILLMLAFTLSGCGEKSVKTTVANSKLEESQICFDCHGVDSSHPSGAVNSVTGQFHVTEWQRSTHNTRNGAGCRDCHETQYSHPDCNLCHGSSPGPTVVNNPDSAGKCAKCHTDSTGFGVSTLNNVRIDTRTAHFNNLTGAGYPASFVTLKTSGACRTCHNPHDTSSNMATLRSWSRSGHGDTTAPPWKTYDFKTRSGDCNRCHTTTGFLKYINDNTDSAAWGSVSDKTKEVLACNACHLDYSYKLRSTGPVTARYAGGASSYPDTGASNLCLNCHVGRSSGVSISNVQRNYTSAAFVNSHYLTAGGILFGEIGYEYTGRNYTDPTFYAHRYIGSSDSRGKSAVSAGSGPCVGCHLANKSGPGEKHTFKPYPLTGIALSPTCGTSGCHSNPLRDQDWLKNTWQVQYQDALAALNYFLANNNFRKLTFIPSSPYFTNKKWHSSATSGAAITSTGSNNMGAAFNYNLLIHDKGGVAHNRYYARRLIYDSIDWLDDNIMNNSVGASLETLTGSGSTGFKPNAILFLIDPAAKSGSERY